MFVIREVYFSQNQNFNKSAKFGAHGNLCYTIWYIPVGVLLVGVSITLVKVVEPDAISICLTLL